MILLTGATGLVGSALLQRLTDRDEPVRCLVRDSRKLGAHRVRVQIAHGDMADPRSYRHALRGVDTVVHLAAAVRDQPRAALEEVTGLGTWRLLRAAERAGVGRFVFFSAIGASRHDPARFFRAKALAEEAVVAAEVPHTIFAPSIVYAPGDPWLTLLGRLALLPAVPVPGTGRTRYEPIWAQDVADCVVAALGSDSAAGRRYELAGPQVMTHDEIVRLVLRAAGRPRRLVHVPSPIARPALRALERVAGPAAFATPEEAELMDVSMVAASGSDDARALGVEPRAMPAVLGVS